MNVQTQIDYWRKGSELDWDTAGRLIANGHDYHWALFLMHISLEKILRALVVKNTHQSAPRIHGLLRLAELAGLTLVTNQVNLLVKTTEFNLQIRYPDEQFEILKIASREFTENHFETLGS